jgi:hypothetical protein
MAFFVEGLSLGLGKRAGRKLNWRKGVWDILGRAVIEWVRIDRIAPKWKREEPQHFNYPKRML